jgi:hypothetical protein
MFIIIYTINNPSKNPVGKKLRNALIYQDKTPQKPNGKNKGETP